MKYLCGTNTSARRTAKAARPDTGGAKGASSKATCMVSNGSTAEGRGSLDYGADASLIEFFILIPIIFCSYFLRLTRSLFVLTV